MRVKYVVASIALSVTCIVTATVGIAIRAATATVPSRSSESVVIGGPFGAVQSFPVPSGVTKFNVTLVAGGGGGSGGFGGFDSFPPVPGDAGGSGGKVVATLTVASGTSSIDVVTGAGGSGGSGQPTVEGATGGVGGTGAGQGGQGGPLTYPGPDYFAFGGGGGGGTSVSVDGTVCLVAGGGGGGGSPASGGKSAGGKSWTDRTPQQSYAMPPTRGAPEDVVELRPDRAPVGRENRHLDKRAADPTVEQARLLVLTLATEAGVAGATSAEVAAERHRRPMAMVPVGVGGSGFDKPSSAACKIASSKASAAHNGGIGGASTPPTGAVGGTGGNGSVTLTW